MRRALFIGVAVAALFVQTVGGAFAASPKGLGTTTISIREC